MKKLNIGCNRQEKEGYTGIDVQHFPAVDEQYDVVQEGIREDDYTIEEIYTSHFIEHLTYEESLDFLKECKRVLIRGGRLVIRFPSLQSMCEAYLLAHSAKNEVVMDSAIWALYGDRGETLPEMHKWGWDTSGLAKELKKLGFRNIIEKPEDLRIDLENNQMFVGNSVVEAIK